MRRGHRRCRPRSRLRCRRGRALPTVRDDRGRLLLRAPDELLPEGADRRPHPQGPAAVQAPEIGEPLKDCEDYDPLLVPPQPTDISDIAAGVMGSGERPRIPGAPPQVPPPPADRGLPAWSVMIPVFNAGAFLADTLRSVLAQ